MAKRTTDKGLGRGLDALFGEGTMLESDERATTLPIAQIEANKNQPRKEIDDEGLKDLAESIKIHGVLQPIIVRKLDNGYYQIISGERRWRAARIAGLDEIPVMIMEADDRTSLEIGLIENLQREDLNPMEEANGYQTLISEYNLTQEEVSERVGKSRSAVANALRLLNLPDEIKNMIKSGELSSGHARALLPLNNSEKQIEIAKRIEKEGLSVRQTENLIKKLMSTGKSRTNKDNPNQIYYIQAEENLSTHLGRKVHITPGKRKGTLELEYYGMEDLNNLLETLQDLNYIRKEEKQ